jgi:hypothetical protein
MLPEPVLKQHRAEKTKKPVIIEQPQTPIILPGAYIEALSLAAIAFDRSPSNISNASQYLATLEAYGEQPQSKVALQPVVVLEYARHGESNTVRIVAPFTMPLPDAKFPALQRIMTAFKGNNYVLDDVDLLVFKMTPADSLHVADYDGPAAQSYISKRLDNLLQDATPPTQAADVRVELQLSRFFMKHRAQDGAWLTLENAKQGLTGLAQSGTLPKVEMDSLTHQVEEQEVLLHKNMPYTF